MLDMSFATFADEVIKLAFRQPPEERVDAHHKASKKDWNGFSKDIKSKKFRQAVQDHPSSDEKLKSYVKAVGEYKDSKDTVGYVLSRSGGRKHRVKKLSSGRLGCSCKSWTYDHSHKKTDCSHIKALKDSQMKKSAASWEDVKDKLKNLRSEDLLTPAVGQEVRHGKIMQENIKRLHAGEPLLELEGKSKLKSLAHF